MPFASSQTERRLTLRLLSYWEKLRRGRAMPPEREITRDDIADLWLDCFIFRMRPDGSLQQHSIGDAIEIMLRNDMNKLSPLMLADDNDRQWFATMQQNQRPCMVEGEFTNNAGRPVRYRMCLLPLGEDGRVTAVLGGMNCKVF
ncbi:MAG: PAS domain-containing protein [Alphaproteobacteria bacterium]